MPQAVLTEQRAGTDSVVQWQLRHVACLSSWLASQLNLNIINVDRIDHQIQQIKYAYNKYPKGSWTTFLIFKSQECFGMCKVPHRNIRCRIIFFFSAASTSEGITSVMLLPAPNLCWVSNSTACLVHCIHLCASNSREECIDPNVLFENWMSITQWQCFPGIYPMSSGNRRLPPPPHLKRGCLNFAIRWQTSRAT